MLLQTTAQYVGVVLLVVFGVGLVLVGRRWFRPSPPAAQGFATPPKQDRPRTKRELAIRSAVLRLLAIGTVCFGFIYLSWRWTSSLNLSIWPLALALVVAETYSYIGALMFAMTVWREKHRGEPVPPFDRVSVDVFITCYNEPVDLVRRTVRAAVAIRYPHQTYVLDDGSSDQMQAMAQAEGVGYIVRSTDWRGRPRHAKAGNLNNALMATQGEFILMLDADQIPTPPILDRMLGYFQDEKVAFVQSSQPFYNVPPGDPFGSDASLFYGPIQQGKDGWNAAFFCGSNALLRREALMQMGVIRYVVELEQRVKRALATADRTLSHAERQVSSTDPAALNAIRELRQIVTRARDELRKHAPIQDVTFTFQRQARAISSGLVAADLSRIRAELDSIPGIDGSDFETGLADALDDQQTLDRLATRDTSPLAAIETVRGLLLAVDVDRGDEAQPIMPLSTISVTEDMATAMRLHALGWKSVFHHESLAAGLAPEDLRSALQQRLRWAQGTLQVFLKENPLFVHGLKPAQRVMYLATMWSYLSGFFVLVYLLAPALYLFFGWLPITAFSAQFFVRIIPYLIVNQLLFVVFGWGIKTWRGQQNSVAMWPMWVTALVTAVRNVYFGTPLGFVVTPKTRVHGGALLARMRLVRAQIVCIVVLVCAAAWGLLRLAVGATSDMVPVLVNVAWIVYDVAMLSAVLDAVTYVSSPHTDATELSPALDAGAETETAAAAHGRVLGPSR
ncbi:MAG: glycosyltransferase [Chloroflexi bacterium]|nr:glycosyltransferase [Chloroflexota bacterium]